MTSWMGGAHKTAGWPNFGFVCTYHEKAAPALLVLQSWVAVTMVARDCAAFSRQFRDEERPRRARRWRPRFEKREAWGSPSHY